MHHLETENWKIQALPLARIKKIMKSEEFVMHELEKERLRETGQEVEADNKPATKFMISGEAPLLMSKACELLIRELSSRAWQHTERNRRRTLQRQDLHAAVGESEVYDFLIDIVPRVTPPSRSFYMNADPNVAAGLPPAGIPLTEQTSNMMMQQQIQQQPQHIQMVQAPIQMIQQQVAPSQMIQQQQQQPEYLHIGLQDYSQAPQFAFFPMPGMPDDNGLQQQQQQQQSPETSHHHAWTDV
jgi:nuclear transcription factor Y, gamma